MIASHRFSSLKPQVAGIALALTIGLSGTVATAQTNATPSSDIICAIADATPAASPEASPVEQEMTGTEVTDEAIITMLTDVVTSCNLDAGAGITDISVTQLGDNLYSVDYQYMRGRQVIRVMETYSGEDGTWTLHQQTLMAPETDEDTITLSAKIGGDNAIEVTPGSFNIVPGMRVNILNRDSVDLSLAVFATEGDVDTESLTGQGITSLPDTLTLEGETLVPAGDSGEILFEGLGEGTYVLVALDSSDTVLGAAPVTIEPPLDLGL